MITIPTGDLVGILSDVIPFASPDEELPTLHSLRLEWSGSALHALATDRYRIGWSAWSPDDDPFDERQPDLFTEWGGADEPWAATITLDDVKHLVKTYKLTGKGVYYVPLTVERVSRAVRIQRAKDTGHSAISTVVEDLFVPYPNLRELLAANDTIGPVTATALYQALGSEQPHHLTVRSNGYALNHGSCPDARCGIQEAAERAPLLSSPHAVGHTYEVWLDDGALRVREVAG